MSKIDWNNIGCRIVGSSAMGNRRYEYYRKDQEVQSLRGKK